MITTKNKENYYGEGGLTRYIIVNDKDNVIIWDCKKRRLRIINGNKEELWIIGKK